MNENLPEQKIIVQNYGYYLMGEEVRALEELDILESLPVRAGDTVICVLGRQEGIKYIDASEISAKSIGEEVFFDQGHYTPVGDYQIAIKLFEGLQTELSKGARSQNTREANDYGFSYSQSKELDDYRKTLMGFYHEYLEPTVGAIVMNCNPFTLGHRYLIDEALKQCAYLAIFVVEEDKSFFRLKIASIW